MKEEIKQAREQIIKILSQLSKEETDVLKRVLQLEQERLYLDSPHIKQELLKIVRETIR